MIFNSHQIFRLFKCPEKQDFVIGQTWVQDQALYLLIENLDKLFNLLFIHS